MWLFLLIKAVTLLRKTKAPYIGFCFFNIKKCWVTEVEIHVLINILVSEVDHDCCTYYWMAFTQLNGLIHELDKEFKLEGSKFDDFERLLFDGVLDDSDVCLSSERYVTIRPLYFWTGRKLSTRFSPWGSSSSRNFSNFLSFKTI